MPSLVKTFITNVRIPLFGSVAVSHSDALETDENRVVRTAVSPVQAGEKLVIIYNAEVKEIFTRVVEAGTSSVIDNDDVMYSL